MCVFQYTSNLHGLVVLVTYCEKFLLFAVRHSGLDPESLQSMCFLVPRHPHTVRIYALLNN